MILARSHHLFTGQQAISTFSTSRDFRKYFRDRRELGRTSKGTPPPRACRLVVPHIKIRRDPKLFMQESPVLASTFRVKSSAGPSGPGGLRYCNTGKEWPLCMNRYSQLELVDENTIRAAREVICFTLLRHVRCMRCTLQSALHMRVILADSIAHSIPGLAALGSMLMLPRSPARRPPAGTPKTAKRSSALATLIPATIWKVSFKRPFVAS